MFNLKIFLLALGKKLWPRVTAYAVFAVTSALAAFLLRSRLPKDIGYSVSTDTVHAILTILASSMLAVTTFSLTVMVSAYASSSSAVSPRATQLVVQDHTAKNVLATFLGTFIFSMSGIVMLNAGVYRDSGRLILFATTVLVIVVMIIVLIRWIDRLTRIGSIGETTRLVQEAACKALKQRAESPCLACSRLADGNAVPAGHDITAGTFGYVQFIDTESLSKTADQLDSDLYVLAVPGTFAAPGTPLLRLAGQVPDDAVTERLRKAFRIADERAFEQDPRFGVCVMAEIALRALPPTVNDPGTVIDVLERLTVMLADFAVWKDEEVKYRRVWMPPLSVKDLFDDAFHAISQSSAELLQVQLRLHKYLRVLSETGNEEYRKYAAEYSRLTLQRSDQTRLLPEEKQELWRLEVKQDF